MDGLMVRVVFHCQSITTKGEKMGRHYNGDIEGKFWFGVQSSDDASFFGGVIEEPSEINYHFNSRNDMKSVVLGLEKVKEKLGANKDLLDKFFKEHDSYNNKMIEDAYGWSEKETREHLEWYARLDLGEKIFKCLKEKDECSFTAEC
jgi:hypothetical protein